MEFNRLINKLNNCSENLSFEKFTKFMRRKYLKKRVTDFLNYLELKIRPEIFISIYLIKGFPKYVLNNIEDKIYLLSKTIIQNINIFYEDIENNIDNKKLINLIKKTIVLFDKKFAIWKKEDIKEQIIYYSNSYYELKEILKTSNHEIYKQEINKIMNKLKNNIIRLDIKDGESFLVSYEKEFNNKLKIEKELLVKKLTHNMKLAFWNKLKLELKETPPNFKSIPLLLKDINLALKTLVPSNKSYRENIDEYINFEYLKQLIEKNQFSFEHIFNLADFITSCLKELGIPEKDKEIEDLKKWLKLTKENKTNFDLSEFLPKFFKEVMDRIEDIQIQIINIKNLINKQINKI